MRKIFAGRRSVSVPFTFEINAGNTGGSMSPANQFYLPIGSGGSSYGPVEFTIDWGDGTTTFLDAGNYATARIHTYASGANYTITCTGAVRDWCFVRMGGSFNDAEKMVNVTKWGDLKMDGDQMFKGCSLMQAAGDDDIPTFEDPQAGAMLFEGCTALKTVGNIAKWQTGILENFMFMFNGCNNLVQGTLAGGPLDLSSWNVSNVTNMTAMFQSSYQGSWSPGPPTPGIADPIMFVLTSQTGLISSMFNGQLSFTNGGSNTIELWDTSNVTKMGGLFQDCLVFNRDISLWDTSNVTDFSSMLASVGPGSGIGNPMIFNQNIGLWDVSSGTNFSNMLTYCNNFDQNLSGWDVSNISSSGGGAFFSFVGNNPAPNNFQLSTANYNALLIAWDAYTFPAWSGGNPTPAFNFQNSTFSLVSPGNAVQLAHDSLTIKLTTLDDGGGI
tara:strand:- start:43 stop:1368 length:1326 start_codon:yes stop_codon:yes gene_type:complete